MLPQPMFDKVDPFEPVPEASFKPQISTSFFLPRPAPGIGQLITSIRSSDAGRQLRAIMSEPIDYGSIAIQQKAWEDVSRMLGRKDVHAMPYLAIIADLVIAGGKRALNDCITVVVKGGTGHSDVRSEMFSILASYVIGLTCETLKIFYANTRSFAAARAFEASAEFTVTD